MLTKERYGERDATLAWIKAPPEARKKAYEDDNFPLPDALLKMPLTTDFQTADKKGFKVKSMFGFRCETCHTDANEVPFNDYEAIEKVLVPLPAAKPSEQP